MRITTGMLKIAHKRSGFSKNGSSLLSYVGKKGGGTSRMIAMNAAGGSAAGVRGARMEQSQYEKLAKSADGLTGAISGLAAKVDSGAEHLGSEAASVVDKFNEVLRNLKSSSGALNQFYHNSMKETSLTNRSELEEIGITVAADGTLALNKEKFEAADKEKIKKLLGTKGDFAQRISHVSGRAADNAGANANSVSSRYNAKGRVADSYLNRYNFRG